MTTPPLFPQLAGQGWSVHKRPSFSTRVASHVSGREVRSSLYAGTLYEFELTFDALASNGLTTGAAAALGATSLQTLLGLLTATGGPRAVTVASRMLLFAQPIVLPVVRTSAHEGVPYRHEGSLELELFGRDVVAVPLAYLGVSQQQSLDLSFVALT